MTLTKDLLTYIEKAQKGGEAIPETRKTLLEKMASFIVDNNATDQGAQLVFICTHNSRRSHISQLWAQVAATHYGIKGTTTYSGGTEATAFHPNAVAAMRRAGFGINATTDGSNPVYEVQYAVHTLPMRVWSKTFDDEANPDKDFLAIMTCSDADEACPTVLGAKGRIALTYEDPKAADGTGRESATYDARCLQIATEMLYCFSQVVS